MDRFAENTSGNGVSIHFHSEWIIESIDVMKSFMLKKFENASHVHT